MFVNCAVFIANCDLKSARSETVFHYASQGCGVWVPQSLGSGPESESVSPFWGS